MTVALDPKFTAGCGRSRLGLSMLCALLFAVAWCGAWTATAQAAPAFDLGLTHSPTTMPRIDKSLLYEVEVGNVAPAVPGVGDQVFCNGAPLPPGTKAWTGQPDPGQYGFRWVRDGVDIPAATSSSYTIAAADVGKALQCVVTGRNDTPAGFVSASQPPLVVGGASPSPPAPGGIPTAANVRPGAPAVSGPSGTAVVAGQTLTCTAPAAGWPSATSWSFSWWRNGAPATGVASQSTATTSTYVLTDEDDDTRAQFQCQATAINAGGSAVTFSTDRATTTPMNYSGASGAFPWVFQAPGQSPGIEVGNETSGPVAVEVELPAGMRVYRTSGTGWACSTQEATPDAPARALCTRSDVLLPQASYPKLTVQGSILGELDQPATATATVSGGGGAAVSVSDDFTYSGEGLPFGIAPNTFFARALNSAGDDYTQAGGHPTSGVAGFEINTYVDVVGNQRGIDHVRTIDTYLPAGFVGNPEATERCTAVGEILADKYDDRKCPPASIVGGVTINIVTLAGGWSSWANAPLFLVPPERGAPAQLMFGFNSLKAVYSLTPRLRPEAGYALAVEAPAVSKSPSLQGVEVTLCSHGAATRPTPTLPVHPGHLPGDTLFDGCLDADDPDAFESPFLTNPTSCPGTPAITTLAVDSWENPGVLSTTEAEAPPVTGCVQVPFAPDVEIAPTSSVAGSASGVEARISVPTDGILDPTGVSQAHLKKTVVTLPEGVSVNPSAASGLEACTDAQLKLGTNDPVKCPDGSKIGTVDVQTPLLEEHLTGEVVLRTPESTDPESGDMLRLAIVARNVERGLLVKLPGSATADSETGRLVATFDDNPQLPFSDLKVSFKGGPRGTVAMPQSCGQREVSSVLTPWSGNAPVSSPTPVDVNGDCSPGFAPSLVAGMSSRKAHASGDFSFRFSRQDSEQWIDGLTAKLPHGLLASVKDVPLCPSAQAEAGSCPAGSRIATVDASAGSGSPFVLERKGDAYLTEGYKGCAYGMMVKVPVVAGPFDKSSPQTDLGDIVVRQAVCVDPSTAQVSAISDPFPRIWHGIPLRVRSVTVNVDRPRFMLNPSDCDPNQVAGEFRSVQGATSTTTTPFNNTDCATLPFKPKLALRLTGRKQARTGKHPGIRAQVNQTGIGEAGIEKAVVRLPKSLALDVNNAGALCEFVDGTKPDLENHCPKASIVGRARAKTPLLKDDLSGNVYFVKNVRKDPRTGNEIRTLPMIVVALRGEIAVNLRGESDTTRAGKLVNTFTNVPDAPISRFNLNINGGSNGILAVTRTRRALINLCARPKSHVAEADMDGHNGRRHDRDIRMKTPCTKKQTRNAKRAAKRAAAKR